MGGIPNIKAPLRPLVQSPSRLTRCGVPRLSSSGQSSRPLRTAPFAPSSAAAILLSPTQPPVIVRPSPSPIMAFWRRMRGEEGKGAIGTVHRFFPPYGAVSDTKRRPDPLWAVRSHPRRTRRALAAPCDLNPILPSLLCPLLTTGAAQGSCHASRK